MCSWKKCRFFLSVICVLAMLLSMGSIAVTAESDKSVYAYASTTVQRGYTDYCYVYIDSTESLAALDVTVHYDPAVIEVLDAYNNASALVYDSVVGSDSVQFSYIMDGVGDTYSTQLFYVYYRVLSDAPLGDTCLDITVGEAYDSALNEVAVEGSRLSITVMEQVYSSSCSIYSTSSLYTSIDQQFTLSYQFSTYEIASGSAVITYDAELFEVVKVEQGNVLTDKVADINADQAGVIYVSFVGTQCPYIYRPTLIDVTFRTKKNVTETATIDLRVSELCDLNLNIYSCSGYTTTVWVNRDEYYVGDAPKMYVLTEYDAETEKVYATVMLEENACLGAGDFVLRYDPAVVALSSYQQTISCDWFLVNDKEAADGVFKFSILSLSDITTSCQVIEIEFDVISICKPQTTVLGFSGSMLVDSMTNRIALNLIDGNIIFAGATGHNYVEEVIPAGCYYDGLIVYTCDACGDSYEEIIPAGHSLVYYEPVVPANCQETGHYGYWYCSGCDGYYSDASANNAIDISWISYTGEHVRPADALACMTVPCELCDDYSYPLESCDIGDAPPCQDATCINCGGYVWGWGCNYNTGNGAVYTPLCQSGTCAYCGTYYEKLYDCTNGSWAPCINDGECAYGCGKQFYATGEHMVDLPCYGGTCWMCGNYIPAVDHTYDNACDAYCNWCGGYRTPSAHQYDNACDAYCNECGSYRTVNPHRFAVRCSVQCVECGYVRANGAAHTYDHIYDADCNLCGYIRDVELVKGDVDGDGAVSVLDAILLQQYLNGWDVMAVNIVSDMNGDAKINNQDLVLLIRLLNGWDIVMG